MAGRRSRPVVKHQRALRLKAATALTLCALATGCTATVTGTVAAAPTLGRAPEPLPDSALPGLLLSAADVGSIMGTSMNVVETTDSMYANLWFPRDRGGFLMPLPA